MEKQDVGHSEWLEAIYSLDKATLNTDFRKGKGLFKAVCSAFALRGDYATGTKVRQSWLTVSTKACVDRKFAFKVRDWLLANGWIVQTGTSTANIGIYSLCIPKAEVLIEKPEVLIEKPEVLIEKPEVLVEGPNTTLDTTIETTLETKRSAVVVPPTASFEKVTRKVEEPLASTLPFAPVEPEAPLLLLEASEIPKIYKPLKLKDIAASCRSPKMPVREDDEW